MLDNLFANLGLDTQFVLVMGLIEALLFVAFFKMLSGKKEN